MNDFDLTNDFLLFIICKYGDPMLLNIMKTFEWSF